MMKNIVLINGKARSGKDTVAQLLKEHFERRGLKVAIRPNAEAVKNVAKCIFGWNEIKDTKGRQLLLDITQAGYNYDPYFWEHKNEHRMKGNDIYIIPDWRYQSTFNYFNLRNNVITINVENENRENIGKLSNHSSETGLDNFLFDYFIDNNGSLEDLQEQLEILHKFILIDLEG